MRIAMTIESDTQNKVKIAKKLHLPHTVLWEAEGVPLSRGFGQKSREDERHINSMKYYRLQWIEQFSENKN